MLPLSERKAMLKKLLRRKRSRILYLDHVDTDGRLLFEQIVKMDLGGDKSKRAGPGDPTSHKGALCQLGGRRRRRDLRQWLGARQSPLAVVQVILPGFSSKTSDQRGRWLD